MFIYLCNEITKDLYIDTTKLSNRITFSTAILKIILQNNRQGERKMTKNDKNVYTTIEVTELNGMCNHIAKIKKQNKKLQHDLEMVCIHEEMLVKENKKLIFENNKLKEELMDIKSLGMFEFADKYCNDKQLADAGHAFARSLLGQPMTNEDLAIEAAENCYVPYNGDDF